MTKRLDLRAELLERTRAFFRSRGYLEVETPSLVPCPGLDLHLDAFETNPTGRARYLVTSPEYQMKRLLVDGHRRIFQICRAFRRGESGQRHNPEFTILEFYRAHAPVDAILRDTEQLVAALTGGRVEVDGRAVSTAPPFERMTLADAYMQYASISTDEMLRLAAEDEDAFFRALVDRVEPGLAGRDRAVFVTDYPATQASLARRRPDDPRFAERFELYVAGVEISNGFGELTDPAEQRARFTKDQEERARRGLAVYPIDEAFLAALERGMPESAGNAIGFDRLVALAAGTTEIGSVMAFTEGEL